MIAHQVSELAKLNIMAKRLAEPALYGTFVDDSHYLSALEILLAATGETDNRLKFFMNHVVSKVQHHHFLDVGVGDGILTRLLGMRFRKMTLVDNSEKALQSISQDDFFEKKDIQKVQASILDADIPQNEYDLAVLSHTLYYIEESKWMTVIKKVFDSLKPNGMLVIVLNGGLDKDQLANAFGGQTINIEKLARDCSDHLEVDALQVFYEREVFQTQTLLPMLHITNLHLYDVRGKASKKEITNFLQSRQNKFNKLYQFFIYQKFILIRKRII